MAYNSLDKTIKAGVIDAYDAWFRNNVAASDILREISNDLMQKDIEMFMGMVSDVLADEPQLEDFKTFIRKNYPKQRTQRVPITATDPGLDHRMKEDIIDAYAAWFRNFKKAKVILHHILKDLSARDTTMFLGLVSDVLAGNRQVDDFKLFIKRNMPEHLSASMQDSQTIHSLLQSMHERILSMEAKLL